MPVDLTHMLIFSLLNPGVIIVGLLVGRAADQVQKIIVGAFVAAIAGLLTAWIATKLGIPVGMRQPRNVAGLFVLGWMLGLFWSWVGFRFLRRT
jgi:uncharacterized membrane protein YeaQ/YmgE (transglycosylase-associated protein family)